MSRILLVGIVVGLLEVLLPFGPLNQPESFNAQSLDVFNILTHAMGGMDGIRYSNSLEAFESNCRKGFRVFEADLILAADGNVIVVHDNLAAEYGLAGSVSKLTTDEFKEAKYSGLNTTLDLDDVLFLPEDRRDAVLVTGVKSDFEATFRVIV